MMSPANPIDAYPTLVIGAGPTGLAFAARCPEPCLILEKDAGPGGLCRSREIDGAMFDVGGHVFHTSSRQVQSFLEQRVELHCQPRQARLAFGHRLIDYPFQQFFGQIEEEDIREECRAGLAGTGREAASADNLQDHLLSRFGAGICRHFLFPYNAKLWGCKLQDLGHGWAGERVASQDRKSGRAADDGTRKRVPLDSASQVYYPRSGGFQSIFDALARDVPVRYGQCVREIDVARKLLFTDTGLVFRWQRLVSTIPIPVLVRQLSGVSAPPDLSSAELQHLSLHLSLLVTAEPLQGMPHRIYVHDPSYPFHKIAFNHESSPELQARPHHAVIGETSFSAQKALSAENIEERLIDFLQAYGLIRGREAIRSCHAERIEHAYPIPLRGLAPARERILAALQAMDIHSIGRFGSWAYSNCDTCLEAGWELARQWPGIT